MASVDPTGDSVRAQRPLPPIRGGVDPRSSSTSIKVAEIAIPLIFFIAIPAVLGVQMHFHVLSIPVGLELVAASTVIGAMLRNVKEETKKLRKEEHHEKLTPQLQKVMRGQTSSRTMEGLDQILEALPKSPETFFEQFPEVDTRRKEVKQPSGRYKANFNTTFETTRAPSSIYDLGFEEPPKGRIGIINGILNNFCHAYSNALRLSHLAGGYNVHGVHNATHGIFADFRECQMGLEGKCTAPVWHLHQMWDDFFMDHQEDDQKFILICHSQGALLTRLALESYHPEWRKRIHVIVVAGAAEIPERLCGSSHHIKSRDPVPKLGLVSGEAVRVTHVSPESIDSHGFSQPMYYEPLQEELKALLT